MQVSLEALLTGLSKTAPTDLSAPLLASGSENAATVSFEALLIQEQAQNLANAMGCPILLLEDGTVTTDFESVSTPEGSVIFQPDGQSIANGALLSVLDNMDLTATPVDVGDIEPSNHDVQDTILPQVTLPIKGNPLLDESNPDLEMAINPQVLGQVSQMAQLPLEPELNVPIFANAEIEPGASQDSQGQVVQYDTGTVSALQPLDGESGLTVPIQSGVEGQAPTLGVVQGEQLEGDVVQALDTGSSNNVSGQQANGPPGYSVKTLQNVPEETHVVAGINKTGEVFPVRTLTPEQSVALESVENAGITKSADPPVNQEPVVTQATVVAPANVTNASVNITEVAASVKTQAPTLENVLPQSAEQAVQTEVIVTADSTVVQAGSGDNVQSATPTVLAQSQDNVQSAIPTVLAQSQDNATPAQETVPASSQKIVSVTNPLQETVSTVSTNVSDPSQETILPESTPVTASVVESAVPKTDIQHAVLTNKAVSTGPDTGPAPAQVVLPVSGMVSESTPVDTPAVTVPKPVQSGFAVLKAPELTTENVSSFENSGSQYIPEEQVAIVPDSAEIENTEPGNVFAARAPRNTQIQPQEPMTTAQPQLETEAQSGPFEAVRSPILMRGNKLPALEEAKTMIEGEEAEIISNMPPSPKTSENRSSLSEVAKSNVQVDPLQKGNIESSLQQNMSGSDVDHRQIASNIKKFDGAETGRSFAKESGDDLVVKLASHDVVKQLSEVDISRLAEKPVQTVDKTVPDLSGEVAKIDSVPVAAQGMRESSEVVPKTEPEMVSAERPTLKTISEFTVKNVRYLISQGGKTMKIRLIPESLGELRLEINSSQGLMNVRLASANPIVREAIEGQIQILQQAFAREGIEIANVTVSADMPSSGGSPSGNFGRPTTGFQNTSRPDGSPDSKQYNGEHRQFAQGRQYRPQRGGLDVLA